METFISLPLLEKSNVVCTALLALSVPKVRIFTEVQFIVSTSTEQNFEFFRGNLSHL